MPADTSHASVADVSLLAHRVAQLHWFVRCVEEEARSECLFNSSTLAAWNALVPLLDEATQPLRRALDGWALDHADQPFHAQRLDAVLHELDEARQCLARDRQVAHPVPTYTPESDHKFTYPKPVDAHFDMLSRLLHARAALSRWLRKLLVAASHRLHLGNDPLSSDVAARQRGCFVDSIKAFAKPGDEWTVHFLGLDLLLRGYLLAILAPASFRSELYPQLKDLLEKSLPRVRYLLIKSAVERRLKIVEEFTPSRFEEIASFYRQNPSRLS